ncbi:hypothetical protein [Bradyrhizobium retamae]|uniref:Uncharacterized protein n=1 Tax=Bradyrhizobium retamae TaxID=1300035 RepID=A0A0R3N6T8_9BRAD|nr:hypothetical protein [Bradyrhizobium retamae]KRR25951.1 hypothetical protein CQ13_23290 [Bradyrhizobium retamae]
MMPAEFRWLEGPIVVKPPTYRQELIESMARGLQEAGTAGDERGAIRWLFNNRYAMADIVMLLDDARALAFQEIVAREMSKR